MVYVCAYPHVCVCNYLDIDWSHATQKTVSVSCQQCSFSLHMLKFKLMYEAEIFSRSPASKFQRGNIGYNNI